MESVTDKWGVRINRVEILDIVPPQNVLQAMALQKQADQEKRAAILQSEGQQLSQINVAEGQKQAQIKQAEASGSHHPLCEGQKQAQILEADGRAQAIATVYAAIKSNDTDAAAARRPPARHAEQVRGQPELEGGGAVRVGRPDGRRPGAALGARQRAGGERAR